MCDIQPGTSAHDGHDQVLCQYPLRDAPPRCAKRGHDSQLPTARQGACEHQIRDVRTRDQEHQANGQHQRFQCRPYGRNDVVLQRSQDDALRHVGERRACLGVTACDSVEAGFGLA